MAWYPGATRMELPESDSQPAIEPTQFILHSIAAPWTARRMYEYWRDSTNLDSHFGLGYAGDLGQYIGTETRADANYRANRRADGTGAVSIETASNLKHTDPWTDAQIEQLIRLGVWLHERHAIPLRICRSASDPGYGYHRLHADWAVSGTACPGDARVAQFKNIVFPGIVARANGQQETPDMDATQARQLAEMHKILVPYMGWQYKGNSTQDAWAQLGTAANQSTAAVKAISSVGAKVDALKQPSLTPEQLDTLAAAVAAHPTLAERIAELVADKLAARLTD